MRARDGVTQPTSLPLLAADDFLAASGAKRTPVMLDHTFPAKELGAFGATRHRFPLGVMKAALERQRAHSAGGGFSGSVVAGCSG